MFSGKKLKLNHKTGVEIKLESIAVKSRFKKDNELHNISGA